MKQTQIDYACLMDNYEPKQVLVHSNRNEDWDKFDIAHLEKMGYKKNDTVKYSIKKGKNTLLSNPFMMEGI